MPRSSMMEGVAGQELGQDAAQAPHVDGHAVPGTQDDLRGPVEPWLDVGVDALVLVAGTSKVDHLEGGKT